MYEQLPRIKMKTLATYIFLAVSFGAIGQNDTPITKPVLLTIDSNIVFKHFEDVQVFQYFNNDSLDGKITHSKKLDSKGNIMAEYYKDYKTDEANGRVDVLKINEYNTQNKLIISTSYYETFLKEEVHKSFFYYSDSLLVRVESFELKKRLKPGIRRGPAGPMSCFTSPEDYEKKRTWEVSRIVLYEYDNKGRITLRYSPVYNSSQNRFEYQYDTEGNLKAEKSLNESKLLYIIHYQYHLNQIVSDLQWDREYGHGKKYIKTFDTHGNLIKESTISQDDEWVDIYTYNKEGKLVLFMAYDSKGAVSLTHIYTYKN